MTSAVTSMMTFASSENMSLSGEEEPTANEVGCEIKYQNVTFVFYAVACSISLVGNVTFFVVVVKVKAMRTIPNFLFINLSMADTLFMTYSIINLIARKFDIKPLLKFHIEGGHSITDVAFCVSMLTVALISLSRYIAICHPFKAQKLKLRSSQRIIVCIAVCWIYGIVVAIGDILIYQSSLQRSLFIVLLFLLVFCILISILTVVVSYIFIAKKMLSSRPRRSVLPRRTMCFTEENQVLFLCVMITVVFFISFSPLAAVYLIVPFSVILGHVAQKNLTCLAVVARNMVVLHFTLNPILYNVGSKNHRTAFRKVCRDSIESLGKHFEL
ncbi:thyrotropin-releasing hormone receptor-like [Glandiceps talaboti]